MVPLDPSIPPLTTFHRSLSSKFSKALGTTRILLCQKKSDDCKTMWSGVKMSKNMQRKRKSSKFSFVPPTGKKSARKSAIWIVFHQILQLSNSEGMIATNCLCRGLWHFSIVHKKKPVLDAQHPSGFEIRREAHLKEPIPEYRVVEGKQHAGRLHRLPDALEEDLRNFMGLLSCDASFGVTHAQFQDAVCSWAGSGTPVQ